MPPSEDANEHLQVADLEYQLTYPQGSDETPAARLVIRDRRTYLIIAEIDMTENDHLNFMRGSAVGSPEGETRLASEQNLGYLNKERVLVHVSMPHIQGYDYDAWVSGAARVVLADRYRISTRQGGGRTATFIFYVTPDDQARKAWVNGTATKILGEQGEELLKFAGRKS